MKGKLGKKGFTLVELMIAIVIIGVVMGVIYGIFITSRRVQSAEEQLVGLAQEARGGLDQMIRELRMANAQRTGVVSNCPSAIIANSPTSVEFEGDVDVDGVLERVLYYLDTGTKTLNRWEYSIADESGGGGWNAPGTRCTQSLTAAPGPVQSAISKEAVAYGIDNLTLKYYGAASALVTNAADITKIALTITAKGELPPNPTRTLTVEVKLPNLGIGKLGGDTTPPAAVQGVTAINPRVCGYLRVTWQANSEPDVAGYRVYYMQRLADGTWPGAWTVSKSVGAAVLSYEFGPGLVNGTMHRVGVAAYDSSANVSSTVTTAEVAIEDDINPTVGAIASSSRNDVANTITINWGRGTDADLNLQVVNAAGRGFDVNFYVYRDTSAAGAFSTQIAGPLTNTTSSYTDTVNDKCVTYYYRVKALDLCGRSSALTPAFGSDGTTRIQAPTIDPPSRFTPGGGTTKVGDTNYAYARFSGQIVDDTTVDTLVISYRRSNTQGGTCPAPPAAYGENQWTDLPDNRVLNLDPNNPIPADASFTGSWDGLWKGYKYLFVAFSRNRCGVYSAPKLPELACIPDCCIDKCQDAAAYPGGTGLGDSCVMDYNTDPIKMLVCDRLKSLWRTKQDDLVTPPAACTAFGSASTKDFFPDQGDGGYLMHRAVETNDIKSDGELYHVLAPDPVTGPIQPFYYSDIFYDGAMPSCERVGSYDETYYRDRCSYRYKVKAVDCALNQSAFEAVQDGLRSSPGVVNTPSGSGYTVSVEGAKKNKVVYWVQNTSAAQMTLAKGTFEWVDAEARLTKAEIYNSVENPGGWRTMWQSGSTSTGVASGSTVTFTSRGSLAGSPVLDPGNPNRDNTVKAQIRLTFYTSGGVAQRMDDPSVISGNTVNEKIKTLFYFINASTTYGASDNDKMCPPADDAPMIARMRFEVSPVPPPTVDIVRQKEPGLVGCSGLPAADGDCSSTATPPSGSKRTDSYGISELQSVLVRARVTPYTPAYPVAQTGDTSADKGVFIYYTTTSTAITTAPQPQSGGAENLTAPTNYTQVSMSNESIAGACTIGSCIYNGIIPALANARVWYYIVATDNLGNYNISPVQATDTFSSSYGYDTCPYNTFADGFESGTFGGWAVTQAGNYPGVLPFPQAVINGVAAEGAMSAYMGTGDLNMCVYDPVLFTYTCGFTASISQNMAISPACGNKTPKLKLKYKVVGTDGGIGYWDWLKVHINGVEVAMWAADTGGVWLPFEYALSAYSGSNISLQISSWTRDSAVHVEYYVDDVRIVYE